VTEKQLTLREARRTISNIIAKGDTVTIAKPYGEVRAFIVPVPNHSSYDRAATNKALSAAKKSFLIAWRSAQAG
jgi:antitoxin (DNA-binding transcriptional repressor) of toxin-antitoxin stability system